MLFALHRRIGFQHRRIDGHGLTVEQLLLGGQGQHKVKHRLVRFLRCQSALKRFSRALGEPNLSGRVDG
jgi:hypothetical protein